MKTVYSTCYDCRSPYATADLPDGDLGPLHMSPVDRAGPVSEISPHL